MSAPHATHAFHTTARVFRALAIGAAVCTLGLLVIGGLVTSLEAGMSVRDATTTQGELLVLAPQADLTPDQRVEHSHRLAGMIVGCVALALAIVGIWGAAVRRLPRGLGIGAGLALCLVCTQGFLGMARVAQNSVGWAMVHAALAQVVFSLLVCLAVAASARWSGLASRADDPRPVGLGMAAVAICFVQVLLGVFTRHLGPLRGGHAADAHILGALLTTGFVGALAMSAMSHSVLRGWALVLVGILVGQLGLGMGAWGAAFTVDSAAATTGFAVGIATAHQALGAVLLAMTVATTLVAWRARVVDPTTAGAPWDVAPADGPAPVPYLPERLEPATPQEALA